MKTVSGNIVDVLNSEIYPGTLTISGGRIVDIIREQKDYENYIIPGLIDAHVHIESSMLIPSEFARVAVIHGTVATVSDPHEIANVLGINGVNFMIKNGETVPFKFYFGASPCIPATPFETSGASLGLEEIEELLKLDQIKYLSEVMNFPGVLNDDPVVLGKIQIARKYGKPIDGHAPGLMGKNIEKYISAGITTDHESITREEALEKIKLGMKILIREGSASKDFEEMIPLVEEHYESCMFCTDDDHPNDLVKGHINDLVKRALGHGIDVMKVLRVACVNPVLHYKLDVGLLRKGDSADFILVDSLDNFDILKTCINGEVVAEEGRSFIPGSTSEIVNNFSVGKKKVEDFVLPYKEGNINVIEMFDHQLITNRLIMTPKVENGCVVSDVERDILKMVVVNRYSDAKVAIGFIKNFGLKNGAIASSVAHDSHNIIAVGVGDEYICRAVNLIIENRGGVCTVARDREVVLPLPIAGLMSTDDYFSVAERYAEIDSTAKSLGSTLYAPFMTLSLMALLVIPSIKLSDKGLFDGVNFEFIDVFQEV
ncbi:MAG: adenine deaminase [Thermodesulfobacteriota bacterium]|nr:adenine deaminase [Thermodesulfobacteriota bacterium]